MPRSVKVAASFVLIFWMASFAYPLLAAFWFRPNQGNAQKLEGVLRQTGTFGDTFGAINSLFSGVAFIALIYTINLQRQQMAREARERREDAFLNALSSLCNIYATIYVSDTKGCDEEIENGEPSILTAEIVQGEGRQYTIKGKLYHYVKSLEINLGRLRRGEDIEVPM